MGCRPSRGQNVQIKEFFDATCGVLLLEVVKVWMIDIGTPNLRVIEDSSRVGILPTYTTNFAPS